MCPDGRAARSASALNEDTCATRAREAMSEGGSSGSGNYRMQANCQMEATAHDCSLLGQVGRVRRSASERLRPARHFFCRLPSAEATLRRSDG